MTEGQARAVKLRVVQPHDSLQALHDHLLCLVFPRDLLLECCKEAQIYHKDEVLELEGVGGFIAQIDAAQREVVGRGVHPIFRLFFSGTYDPTKTGVWSQ